MISRVFKLLAILAVASFIAGCNLEAILGSGGELKSISGTRDCAANSLCQFEINDTNFSDSFIATPKPGYVFSHWKEGDEYLCSDSTDPICTASNTEFAGNAGIEAYIASDESMYIMPIFELAESEASFGTVVGRDPTDSSRTITIGPLVSIQSAHLSFVAAVEHQGKTYGLGISAEHDDYGIRGGRYNYWLFSDSGCQDVLGRTDVAGSLIAEVKTSNGSFLYAIDASGSALSSNTATTYSEYRQVGPDGTLGCVLKTFSEEAWIFPAVRLTITKEELLNGAVAPYTAMYN